MNEFIFLERATFFCEDVVRKWFQCAFLLLECRLWLLLCAHLHETVCEEERKQRKENESISFQLNGSGEVQISERGALCA